MIWVPYIIFQNTDDDEAVKVDAMTEDGNIRTKVSVKREQNFIRSGLDVADEVESIFKETYNSDNRFYLQIEIFRGDENLITMSQTHSKKFHCIYLLQYYPFDTQICKVDLQVEEFDKRNVELIPDNMDLLTDTELTQYYIKAWSLDYNDPSILYFILKKNLISILELPTNGLKMEIVFKRRLTNEILTTYLPSFLLLLMSYATTFFKPIYFEASVTVNLSILLVTTTLFIRQIT